MGEKNSRAVRCPRIIAWTKMPWRKIAWLAVAAAVCLPGTAVFAGSGDGEPSIASVRHSSRNGTQIVTIKAERYGSVSTMKLSNPERF
ncbi:MAG: hypothetical protein LBJ10_02545, partial [Clostridiales bacterium]|nr:hypothetical protein [Clostridiales bacterium]